MMFSSQTGKVDLHKKQRNQASAFTGDMQTNWKPAQDYKLLLLVLLTLNTNSQKNVIINYQRKHNVQ